MTGNEKAPLRLPVGLPAVRDAKEWMVNSYDIIHAVTRIYSPYSYDVAYNTTGVLPWEADMVVLSRSGYISEIEIKVSFADFKADFTGKPDKHEQLIRGIAPNTFFDKAGKKEGEEGFKWGGCEQRKDWDSAEPHAVRYFYFAIPVELREKIEPLIPDYAGLIVCDKRAHVIKKAPTLKQSRKANEKEWRAILKAMYYRGWKRFQEGMHKQEELFADMQ